MIKAKVFNWVSHFNKKSLLLVLFIVVLLLPVVLIYAQTAPTTIINPIGATSIQGLIKKILEGVIKIGIPIVALAIIYSGFLFVQARGNPGEIEKAKTSLIYTLIGTAILLGSWGIAQLISETVTSLSFNLSIINYV